MDPLSGFSLAAGILQVLDISFKAVGACRQVYKDGSLAEQQDMGEIAAALGILSLGSLLICLKSGFEIGYDRLAMHHAANGWLTIHRGCDQSAQ